MRLRRMSEKRIKSGAVNKQNWLEEYGKAMSAAAGAARPGGGAPVPGGGPEE